ncbi:hypothetical protein HNY73_003863 [Argiope bruennichi]|uniref:Uncharacterized protein n=1 Tax=Argiope bruennichi TaxID=94029 RepID=A0A8T0FRW4_ARGBR|nr:hypothetical protein HNY73_003863 [Argiope bruennichi]
MASVIDIGPLLGLKRRECNQCQSPCCELEQGKQVIILACITSLQCTSQSPRLPMDKPVCGILTERGCHDWRDYRLEEDGCLSSTC